jgi:hypothetical protein
VHTFITRKYLTLTETDINLNGKQIRKKNVNQINRASNPWPN